MAAPIQKGQAVLYGLGTAVSVAGFVALVDTGKASHKFKLDNIEGYDGEDAALIATNEMIECEFVFMPEEDQPAESADGFFLQPLSTVTTSGFISDILNADNWIYVGDASIDLSHKAAKVTLKLRRYIDNPNLS